jgi:hypothetical protein
MEINSRNARLYGSEEFETRPWGEGWSANWSEVQRCTMID